MLHNAAIDRLIEAHGKTVYGLCLKLTGKAFDADDLYQETFLVAMRKTLKSDGNEKAYLCSICINQWKSRYQKEQRRRALAPQEDFDESAYLVAGYDDVEGDVLKKDVGALIRMIVSELPERYRLAILLFYNAGLSLEEAAKALKLPVGTVKSHLHRAKMLIKKKLEALGYDE